MLDEQLKCKPNYNRIFRKRKNMSFIDTIGVGEYKNQFPDHVTQEFDDFEDFVVRSGAESQFIDSLFDEVLAGFIQYAEFSNLSTVHSAVCKYF